MKNKSAEVAKKAVGRPTKMTEVTIMKLENAFMLGCPVTVACKSAGIHPDTYYAYIKKHPEFELRKDQLQHEIGAKARKVVLDAIDGGDVRVAMDYLKRRYKNEFAQQLHHTV
jgi:hypothetical protein